MSPASPTVLSDPDMKPLTMRTLSTNVTTEAWYLSIYVIHKARQSIVLLGKQYYEYLEARDELTQRRPSLTRETADI